MKVDPSSGIAYLPNKGCGGGQAVAVSEDSGLTWEVRPVTGSTPGDSDPSVGIGSNGTVYFGYQAADGHARVATSHDHGKTWVDGQDVGAQLGVQNVVFPAMVAGDDDRAAFAFLGSTTGGNYQDAANFHGDWHLYIATTIDGGAVLEDRRRHADRPGPARLDLHRRHHLRQRPQPARLHGHHRRRRGPRAGRVRRRLHRCLRRTRWGAELRRARHDRPADRRARACSPPSTPSRT